MARGNEDVPERYRNLTTADIRDNYKIAQYRINSQSRHKKSKDVAHYVSLRIAVKVMTEYRAVGRIPDTEIKDVKYFTHLDINLRMVKRETNQRHDDIDRDLIAIVEAGRRNDVVVLTKEQYKRAFKQVSIIKASQRLGPNAGQILSDVTYNSFAGFYNTLRRPPDGNASVWESVTSEDEVISDSESEDEYSGSDQEYD